jgi:hypothetical protein
MAPTLFHPSLVPERNGHKMKKALSVCLTAVIALAFLSACNSTPSQTQPAASYKAQSSSQATSTTTAPQSTAPEYEFYTVAHSQTAADGKKLNVIFKYKENTEEQIIYKAMIQIKNETTVQGGTLNTRTETYFTYNIPLTSGAFDTAFTDSAPPITGQIGNQKISGTITYGGSQYSYEALTGITVNCADCRGTGTKSGAAYGSPQQSCGACDGMGVVFQ